MKVSTTAKRLKHIMQLRNLKQVDVLNLAKPYCEKYDTKLTKVDLSQYVSGKVEPGQAKLFVLANALHVSEAWLMGLDVPSTPTPYSQIDAETYALGQTLEKFDTIVTYFTNFRKVLNILGYSLCTEWKTDSKGNMIDLLEDKDYQYEIPHSKIKEVAESSRSFIEFQLKQLLSDYEAKNRNKEFDDLTDEEFNHLYCNDEYILPDAAHDRTDIPDSDRTDNARKVEDDMMDDPNF